MFTVNFLRKFFFVAIWKIIFSLWKKRHFANGLKLFTTDLAIYLNRLFIDSIIAPKGFAVVTSRIAIAPFGSAQYISTQFALYRQSRDGSWQIPPLETFPFDSLQMEYCIVPGIDEYDFLKAFQTEIFNDIQ